MEAEIASHADFDNIRYAQLWEDADVLLLGLGEQKGATLVSICSAGDNALAMLTLDPARVVTVDLSNAQLACLRIRIQAYQHLDHGAFLELMGARPSTNRLHLLDQVARHLDSPDQAFWSERKDDVDRFGLGGAGKFERYFRIFQRYLLPLAQTRSTLEDVFERKPLSERRVFLDHRWNNWRWKLLLKTFFSNFVMGRLGRDPAFFAHVDGSLAEHVARRIEHAAVDLEPADNPYLHWILTGTHGEALPLAWREEQFETIRDRLARLELRFGALETFVATGDKADGFNLSDIFEYMTEATFETVYGSVLSAAHRHARLVYWNMMVPRRVPKAHADKVVTLQDVERAGAAMDKAFFYSDFVVEQVQ
ncbi:MAG: DUF3419 family protein [Pseudomonadota bacterium]